jgi:hypothetical protein
MYREREIGLADGSRSDPLFLSLFFPFYEAKRPPVLLSSKSRLNKPAGMGGWERKKQDINIVQPQTLSIEGIRCIFNRRRGESGGR